MTTVPFGAHVEADRLLEELGRRQGIPLTALVQLTRRCNLSCRHCYQVQRGGAELTTGEWGRVLDRLADAGVLLLTFTGGEPAVRADLVDLVRLARARSFAVKLKSNGVLLDEPTCDDLAAAPVVAVDLSLYSTDAALHDRVTGCPGSHARTLRAARRLRDRGVRVQLNCAVQADTFEAPDAMLDFAAQEGMHCAFDAAIQVQEDGCSGPASHRLSVPQLERLWAHPRLSLLMPPRPNAESDRQSVCRVGEAMVVVAPDGDVWPCLHLAERLGNLLEAPLRRIWVGNAVLERYKRICWNDLPTCRSCEHQPFCVRCHAAALVEDGDLLGPSRLACESARVRARLWNARRRSGLAPADGSRRLASAGAAAGAADGPQASTGR